MNEEQTALHPIDEAARVCPGGRGGLSRALNVTTAAIGNWKHRNSIPVEYCALIEKATNGTVTRRELRPNDWQKIWPELATATDTTTAEGQGA
jgi:DNA-binding transcriptional regulator YdaS (Cro superfamily)